MGVPALFRWLSKKYPKIIAPVIEEKPRVVDGQEVPIDITKPNPNGVEYDNLYLDMNGIIHPCSHPEDRPPPATEEEMMLEIFKFTERVVNMVRPRKVLMLAIDGVAPRAKMNQQRSRRFRSAQEAKEKDEEKAEFLQRLRQQNNGILPENLQEEMSKKTWDSNSITPGTPFMELLAVSLEYWTAYKLSTDPAWENLKVIVSDASVPGEGEHKIMEFIRSQRSSPEHDPNTRHVICGLDADLIMLGLGTHEAHFSVLREDVFFNDGKPRTCKICGQTGHKAEECRGEAKKKQGEFDEKATIPTEKPFIWLHVYILREYLAVEMNVPNCGFKFDLERALDDWVFMCFFVGNDFLPHLPSLDIRDQAIDTLIAIWRDNLPTMGGYVTKDGFVNLERAQVILEGLAKQEDAIFIRRHQAEQRQNANAKRRKLEDQRRLAPKRSGESAPQNGTGLNLIDLDTLRDTTKSYRDGNLGQPATLTHQQIVNRDAAQNANQANKSAAAVLKERLLSQGSGTSAAATEIDQNQTSNNTAENDEETQSGSKRKRELNDNEEGETSTPNDSQTLAKPDPDDPPPDDVRLWSPGYADRYYEQKFHVSKDDHEFRHKVARAYAEGLAWVLLYYFQGCPSWTWYYPYHYAPFAADFVDISSMELNFVKGKPFRPYEQLMGVLPAASNHAIPKAFHPLMTDEDSDILEFYPEDFAVDLNGKKFAWQGVVILPFIDATRLLKAMATKYPLLSEDEKRRNELGRDTLFISDRHPLYESVASNFYSKTQGPSTLVLSEKLSDGLAGQVQKNEDYLPQSSLVSPLREGAMPDLDEDHSIKLHYEFPKSEHVHKSMILRGAKFAPPALNEADKQFIKGMTQRSGRSYGGAPLQDRNGGGRGGRGGGRINYAPDHHNNDSRHDNGTRANPFAAHLNPSFFPNGVPAPGMATATGQAGYPAPPPHYSGGGGRGRGMAVANPSHAGHSYGHQQPPRAQQYSHSYDNNNNNNGNNNSYGSQNYQPSHHGYNPNYNHNRNHHQNPNHGGYYGGRGGHGYGQGQNSHQNRGRGRY